MERKKDTAEEKPWSGEPLIFKYHEIKVQLGFSAICKQTVVLKY